MAFNAKEAGKQIVEYAPDDVFSALLLALSQSSAFSVKDSNGATRTIRVSAGISWTSWGENLLITVSPVSDGFSEVAIASTSKYGIVDWGKNQKNFSTIMNLMSQELQYYQKVTPKSEAESTDAVAQIRKLAELRDAGILTEEEFRQKKAELLAKL